MLFSIKYVHRLKWNGLYQSLMWSCFGIMFMLLYPVSPDLMTFIGGVMLLFQGVPQLILFLEEDERFLISLLSLVECLLVSFLGVWMLTNQEEVYDTLPAVLAFVTFLHAFSNLIITGRIRHLQYSKWWIAALVTAAKMPYNFIYIVNLWLWEPEFVCSSMQLVIFGCGKSWRH